MLCSGVHTYHRFSGTRGTGDDKQMLAGSGPKKRVDSAADLNVDLALVVQHDRIFFGSQRFLQIPEAGLSQRIDAGEEAAHHVRPGGGRKKPAQIRRQPGLFALDVRLMPVRGKYAICSREKLLFLLKIVQKLAAFHFHLPIAYAAVVHLQMLGICLGLQHWMGAVLITAIEFGKKNRDIAACILWVFSYGAPLLQLKDQHKGFSSLSPFAQQHSVNSTANGCLIFQNQCQCVQPCLVQHLDQNGNRVLTGSIF